ncbi:MAG: TraR/DksA family transcriptional regulator [Acidobacteriota bacterium]|nr:MAG: TraR/DksA family transcriptional regulator [Acidobacteriota bacterium]
MGEYDTIRESLTSRYEEIQARLGKIVRDRRHVNQPLEKDFSEQAIETENDEVLDALDAGIRAEMSQIERTLERIESGEYGICVGCGEKIPEKRLLAVPETIRCVFCELESTT